MLQTGSKILLGGCDKPVQIISKGGRLQIVEDMEETIRNHIKGPIMRDLPHLPKPFFNREGIEAVQKERLDLGVRKNHDYSGTSDNIAICGVEGIATRLMDKAGRLHSLVQPGTEAKVTDEGIRDTLFDIGNYADYGVCLLDGTWGKVPFKPVVAFTPKPLTAEERFANAMKGTFHYVESQKKYWAVSQYGFARSFGIGDEIPFVVLCSKKGRKMGKATAFTFIQTKRTAMRVAQLWSELWVEW